MAEVAIPVIALGIMYLMSNNKKVHCVSFACLSTTLLYIIRHL